MEVFTFDGELGYLLGKHPDVDHALESIKQDLNTTEGTHPEYYMVVIGMSFPVKATIKDGEYVKISLDKKHKKEGS